MTSNAEAYGYVTPIMAGPSAEATEIKWHGGVFDDALSQAGAKNQMVMVYFWVGGSKQCENMYESVLQTEAAAKLCEPFFCYGARRSDTHAGPLFEKFNVTTVPALRFISADGVLEDAVDGFADLPTLGQNLSRIAEGKNTLSDLRTRTETTPDDLDLRYLLAGKLFDLGHVSEQNDLIATIREDDPEGKTEAGATLLFQNASNNVFNGATTLADIDDSGLRAVAASVNSPSVRRQCWNTLGYLDNIRGDLKDNFAATRNAFADMDDQFIWRWSEGAAGWIWANRDVASKADKQLALEIASRSLEVSEELAAGNSDQYDDATFLAPRVNTLARCLHMNGKRKAAIEAAKRCVELDIENPEYARRLEAYEAGEPDGPFHVYNDHTPVWSPDGRSLLFASNRDGNDELYLSNTKKGTLKRITRFLGGERPADFVGKEIVYTSNRFQVPSIYSAKSSGSGERMVIPLDPNNPLARGNVSIHPKGKKIAYLRQIDSGFALAIAKRDGSEERVFDDATTTNTSSVSWLDDEILFTRSFASNKSICRLNPESGEITTILEDSAGVENPHATKNGKAIVYSRWDGPRCRLYTMQANGEGQTPLTDGKYVDQQPRFSPDGLRVAFARTFGDGSSRILVVELGSNEPEVLVKG